MNADVYALPVVEPDAEPDRPRRVLLLEADDQLRSKLVGDLAEAGFDVLHASNENDALVAWLGSATPIDLLILDPSASEGDGGRLWRHFSSSPKSLQVLILVAGPAREGWTAAREPAASAAADELIREVKRLLGPCRK